MPVTPQMRAFFEKLHQKSQSGQLVSPKAQEMSVKPPHIDVGPKPEKSLGSIGKINTPAAPSFNPKFKKIRGLF